MSEKLEALKASLTRDEDRIEKLQEEVKKKKERIKEMESAEILSTLNSMSAKGFDISGIISAIRNKDYTALMQLMKTESENTPIDESGAGTGSAFQIQKEDAENEQRIGHAGENRL